MCKKTRHMEDEGMALHIQLADWLELSENLGISTFLDYGYTLGSPRPRSNDFL